MTDPHHCDNPGPYAFEGYGDALDEGCHEDERGFFWIGNGEYGSPVAYCPHCGAKAPMHPRYTLRHVDIQTEKQGSRRYLDPETERRRKVAPRVDS